MRIFSLSFEPQSLVVGLMATGVLAYLVGVLIGLLL